MITRLLGEPTRKAIVEVNDGNTWGRICVEGWAILHGKSVCKEHGYEGAIAILSLPFDMFDVSTAEQTDVLINPDPECSGGNLNSIECRSDISAACKCSNVTAGVICCKYYEALL